MERKELDRLWAEARANKDEEGMMKIQELMRALAAKEGAIENQDA